MFQKLFYNKEQIGCLQNKILKRTKSCEQMKNEGKPEKYYLNV